MTIDHANDIEIPEPEIFFLETPLYEKFKITHDDRLFLHNIKYFPDTLDCYCIHCKSHSIFQSILYNKNEFESFFKRKELVNETFTVGLYCTRDTSHQIFFIFRVESPFIMKIGQYPSIADLTTSDLKKYKEVLSPESHSELIKAVGLTSHGIGVGAFVYLRRVFELLLTEAYNAAKQEEGWDDEKYNRLRIGERIPLLKHHLPDFLVDNASLYSILSKGIHELTEDECLEAFPIVKVGIELILDEKLEAKRRQQKIESTKKSIGSLTSKLKRKS